MHRIDVIDEGRAASHLAVRFDRPRADVASHLSFLYLHGFGSDQSGEKAEFFRRRAVESGFGFCSFDFQGHGQSGGTMRDLTLSRNLDDVSRVRRFLAERGCERICLLGSSMGGGTGLWFAALHPGEVVAGLHIAPALHLDRALVAWAGPERARAWQETGAIHFENDLVSCKLGWGLIEDLRAHPAEDLRSRHRTPALLLQGKKDDSVPWQGVADFAAGCACEEIELHLFADGDHRLTDRKERLWDLMTEFLRGRGLV
ncbi:MAG TPA: alpha/beta fold hydrolase [Thermoanaerobaculia bacterium]|nr:alpha/beta fold hydrolase [Thermoanaerobaculia bacterium]